MAKKVLSSLMLKLLTLASNTLFLTFYSVSEIHVEEYRTTKCCTLAEQLLVVNALESMTEASHFFKLLLND